MQAGEYGLVLSEMCGLLAATHGILEGINRGDMKHIAQAVRAGCMADQGRGCARIISINNAYILRRSS